MNIIYNTAVNFMHGALKVYGKMLGKNSSRKFSLFVKGQSGIKGLIRRTMKDKPQRPTIWIHAASLGEYAVARPLIAKLKRDGDCTIVLTFFSPSGYRALEHNHPGVDYLFYLPLDTKRNVRAFLNAVQPDKAVFIISEYWPNYLQGLKFRAIPTYLVSAIIRDDAPFFRWYGRIYRKSLSSYSRIYVLDKHSRFNLNMLGVDNVTVSGDPLFDNAETVAQTPWHNETIHRFCHDRKVFIAGSISDERDLQLVSELANRHPDTRFLFVPHDINPDNLRDIQSALNGKSMLYSQCTPQTDLSDTQVLIADFVGALAYMYRYATWAYVGGGFTPLLHSVIEATVYGIPVSFGPQIHRKVTPQQMIDLGIGQIVTNADDLDHWFTALKDNPEKLDEIRKISRQYVQSNIGATEDIVKTLEQGIWANV